MPKRIQTTEAREHPILFSGPMVKAILDGRKIQTRRVVNPQPLLLQDPIWSGGSYLAFKRGKLAVACLGQAGEMCPYGKPGDRLWVRETWADADCMYQSHVNDVPGTIAYFADKRAIQYNSKTPREVGAIDRASWNWDVLKRRPSIFMPRWASRITLEIKGVRVERLQDISPTDAIAEGIQTEDYCRNSNHVSHQWCAVEVVERGWDKINGKRKGCTWSDNPWVWVIEFSRV